MNGQLALFGIITFIENINASSLPTIRHNNLLDITIYNFLRLLYYQNSQICVSIINVFDMLSLKSKGQF